MHTLPRTTVGEWPNCSGRPGRYLVARVPRWALWCRVGRGGPCRRRRRRRCCRAEWAPGRAWPQAGRCCWETCQPGRRVTCGGTLVRRVPWLRHWRGRACRRCLVTRAGHPKGHCRLRQLGRLCCSRCNFEAGALPRQLGRSCWEGRRPGRRGTCGETQGRRVWLLPPRASGGSGARAVPRGSAGPRGLHGRRGRGNDLGPLRRARGVGGGRNSVPCSGTVTVSPG